MAHFFPKVYSGLTVREYSPDREYSPEQVQHQQDELTRCHQQALMMLAQAQVGAHAQTQAPAAAAADVRDSSDAASSFDSDDGSSGMSRAGGAGLDGRGRARRAPPGYRDSSAKSDLQLRSRERMMMIRRMREMQKLTQLK